MSETAETHEVEDSSEDSSENDSVWTTNCVTHLSKNPKIRSIVQQNCENLSAPSSFSLNKTKQKKLKISSNEQRKKKRVQFSFICSSLSWRQFDVPPSDNQWNPNAIAIKAKMREKKFKWLLFRTLKPIQRFWRKQIKSKRTKKNKETTNLRNLFTKSFSWNCEGHFWSKKAFTPTNKNETQMSATRTKEKTKEGIFLAFVIGWKTIFFCFDTRNILTIEARNEFCFCGKTEGKKTKKKTEKKKLQTKTTTAFLFVFSFSQIPMDLNVNDLHAQLTTSFVLFVTTWLRILVTKSNNNSTSTKHFQSERTKSRDIWTVSGGAFWRPEKQSNLYVQLRRNNMNVWTAEFPQKIVPSSKHKILIQTSQTNNTVAGQSNLHKQHKSCRQYNKIWQRDSGACSSTFTLTDKETTSHSGQRRTLKRNRASRFLLDILSVRTELCDKSKAETRHVRALCERRGGWERALAKRRRVGSSFEGLSTDEADSAAKNLHLYKAHKSIVSSQHQSYKAQQENLQPGEVLVVLDFKENLQVGSGPIEVGNDCSSKTQVSWLGFAVYIGGNTATHFFDCVSWLSLMMDCLWERVWTKSFLEFKKFLLWKWNSEFLGVLFCFYQFLTLFFLM